MHDHRLRLIRSLAGAICGCHGRTRYQDSMNPLLDKSNSDRYWSGSLRFQHFVDFEWACSAPAEMFRPPYWLTGSPVDLLTGENVDSFTKAKDEFLRIFEKKEKLFPLTDDCSYRTNIMKRGWTIGNFWYLHALESPRGLYNLFLDHIQPRYA